MNDIKSFLHQFCENTKKEQPQFEVRRTGPKHRQRFLCNVHIRGFSYVGLGNSTTKKLAETNAARDFVNYFVREGVINSSDVPELQHFDPPSTLKVQVPQSRPNKAMPFVARPKSAGDLRMVGKPAPPSRTALDTNLIHGQKRPAAKNNENGSKRKVPRIKILDWDYKSRFQELQKKHGTLQGELKKAVDKVTSFEKLQVDLKSLQASHALQHEQLLFFKTQGESLTTEKNRLYLENNDLTAKLRELEKKLNELQETNAQLREELLLSKTSIEALTVEKDRLGTENTDLVKSLSEREESLQALREEYERLKNVESELGESRRDNCTLREKCSGLETHVALLKEDFKETDALRRHLHNTIQDLKGNIRVFCRVRPPINDEERERRQCSISFLGESSLEIRKSRESIFTGKMQDAKLEFNFDKVFTPEAKQTEVFEELAQLVQSALDGYHVCVFAYGQTGSGKTHTMQGSVQEKGMIPRTIDLIFEKIAKLALTGWSYRVTASFLEIYNKNIRDLLVPNSSHNYELCYNEGRGVTVTNLKTVNITKSSELKRFMAEAQTNRAVAATNFNEHSSRSHAITRIHLEGINNDNSATFIGSVNLVDLAGSESTKTSSTPRLAETININKSLSALGNVMLSLHNNSSHIPYRDSKLTFLLQSCLGGNSKTLMIVNISPFEECFGESISSLRFAAKVKEVKTNAKRNKTHCMTPLVAKQS